MLSIRNSLIYKDTGLKGWKKFYQANTNQQKAAEINYQIMTVQRKKQHCLVRFSMYAGVIHWTITI